jgi:hypothetical protein
MPLLRYDASWERPLIENPALLDIFEGTEQIQQLVIDRAISGMRIE